MSLVIEICLYENDHYDCAEFTIKPKTSGQELFDQIIQTTGIREKW